MSNIKLCRENDKMFDKTAGKIIAYLQDLYQSNWKKRNCIYTLQKCESFYEKQLDFQQNRREIPLE